VGGAHKTWSTVKDRLSVVLRAVDRRLPARIARLGRRFADSSILLSASSLAFYGLVSALPLLLITFAIVEAFTGDETLQRFADQVSQSGPEGTGQLLDQLVANGGSLTFATLLFTIWPATAYGGGLRRALTRHADRSESGIRRPRPDARDCCMILVLPAMRARRHPPDVLPQHPGAGRGARDRCSGGRSPSSPGRLLATATTTLLYRGSPRRTSACVRR
jgi:hypothetical protein